MTPYDGSGYGISMYWRSQMKDIANQSGEECPCWSNSEPSINFISKEFNEDLTDVREFRISVKCKKKTDLCNTSFNNTEKELLNKFKIFYKV